MSARSGESDLIPQLEDCEVFYGPDFTDGGRFFRASRWVGLTNSQGFYDVEEFATEEEARLRFDALTTARARGLGQ